MNTTTHHAQDGTTAEHFESNIVLANGTIAGTGYGPSEESSLYWACLDAVELGHFDAACGHSRYLDEGRERTVRAAADEARK